jgi:hypothetical protein
VFLFSFFCLWFNLQDFFLFFVSSSSPDLSNCG